MDYQSIVAGLLAKAESTDSEAEASALVERATYLMAKYQIDVTRSRKKEDSKVIAVVFPVGAPYTMRRAQLLNGIVTAFGAQCIMLQDKTVRVFGYFEDLVQIKNLYLSLITQMATHLNQTPIPPGANTKNFRSSWTFGYVTRLVERVTAAYVKAEEEAIKETPGTDLVLVRRKDEIVNALDEEYPLHSQKSIKVKVRVDAYDSGVAAANSTDIGQKRIQ